MRIQLWQSKVYPSKDHNYFKLEGWRNAVALTEGNRVIIMPTSFDEKPDNVLADITKSMYNVLLVKQLIREL